MTTQTYALYVTANGLVINLFAWDGVSPWSPPSGIAAVLTGGNPNAQIGGTYITGVFTPPSVTPPQGIMDVSSPVTGFTHNCPNPPQPQNALYTVFEPAGPLATGTLVLPPNPQDGAVLYVLSTQTITTLNVQAGAAGQGLINIPGSFTLAGGVSQHITYSAQFNSWFRL